MFERSPYDLFANCEVLEIPCAEEQNWELWAAASGLCDLVGQGLDAVPIAQRVDVQRQLRELFHALTPAKGLELEDPQAELALQQELERVP